MNRSSADAEVRLPLPRAGMAWRALIDTQRSRDARAQDRARRPGAPARPLLAHSRRGADRERRPRVPARPALETIDKLAERGGYRRANGLTSRGKRTIVSPETKIALLAALGLEAGERGRGAREPDAAHRRDAAPPPALLARAAARRAARSRRLRDHAAAQSTRASSAKTAPPSSGASRPATASAATCPTGAPSPSAPIALPALPVGRYRLIVDGVECALTVAPPEAYSSDGGAAQAVRRRRPALRPAARGRRPATRGSATSRRSRSRARRPARRGGLSRRQPAAHAVPARPGRASPYYPSDRRFLDPIFIDALDGAGLPRDEALDARARRAARRRSPPRPRPRMSSMTRSGAPSARRSKPGARPSLALRAARPGDPLVADYRAFVTIGRRSFAALRRLPGDRRRRSRRGLAALAAGLARRRSQGDRRARSSSNRQAFEFALFCQWLADRQLGAGRGARARGAAWRSGSIAISRSARRRTAPKPGRTPRELARGVTIGAPPDPFSVQGQNWSLPAPNPLAGARDGWASLSALYRANMRHAGMLRIDHAMGLERLFLIPDGARPAEGAYLAYPLDDLIGQSRSKASAPQCMVVGEDLGTVPEGFRDRLTRANIAGMRVLWFERDGAEGSAAGGSIRRCRSPASRRTICRRSPAGGGRRHRRAALARPPDAWPRPATRSPRGARRSAA